MLDRVYLERYADVMVWALTTARQSTGGTFVPGDVVLVRFDRPALALAEYISMRLTENGFNALLRLDDSPAVEKHFLINATDAQLTFVGPWEGAFYRSLNGLIMLEAPTALEHLKDVPSQRQIAIRKARKKLTRTIYARSDRGQLGWTRCTIPTPVLARKAGMPLVTYEEEVIKACYLNRTDPISAWRETIAQAQVIKNWLLGLAIAKLHIESERTDLVVTPGPHRQWLGLSGHNIPSFEIFTSPDWRGTRGVYYANTPSIRNGNVVSGISLTFERGAVVKAETQQGERYLLSQLEADPGARRIGEFSLTDKRFSPIARFMADIIFDENVGQPNGNCHIALGFGFSEALVIDQRSLTAKMKRELGLNDSVIHWDMLNTEPKVVTAHLCNGDRKVIYEDGCFTY